MFKYNTNLEGNTPFTLYFKQKEVVIKLSKQELVNLIKESIELLKLSGKKQHLFDKESSIQNSANLN